MKRVLRGILLSAGILALFAGPAHAQAIGQIFGKVTDDTGGVLPGVTVTVTGTGLQQPLVATTTGSGAYQFPVVPIGTYTVAFELSGFKKASRPNIIITDGFNAEVNTKLAVGTMTEEVTVSAAPPVVDTKKTTTGGTFTKDILENIPTARDPWQIINMAPGVQLSGINVGGSASGQQLTPSVYGTSSNVQWNLEGGSVTDLSSNSSASYYNFDSFEQISVTTGGGDVSVQSSGLSINLVTKSGSNVFKGTAVTTFENDKMQGNNVTSDLFSRGAGGLLSGAPLKKITNNSIEYGGPIKKNRLWWWAAADRQDIQAGVLNFFDPTLGANCAAFSEAQRTGTLAGSIAYNQLNEVADCLKTDKTLIKDLQWKINYQLNSANKFQYLFTSDDKIRNARGASSTTAPEATQRQYSDAPANLPYATHSLTHTLIVTDKLVFNNQFTYVHGGFYLDYQDSDSSACGSSKYTGADSADGYSRPADCLWNQQQLSLRTTGFQSRSLLSAYQTIRPSTELKTDATYFMSNLLGGDHSLKFGVGYRKNPIQSFSHYSGGARAWYQCAGNNSNNCGDGQFVAPGSATGLVPYRAVLYRDGLLNNDWWTYNGYLQDSYSRGRLRVNGGVRYDWQNSKYLGGCVPANVIRPDLLPAQCEAATSVDATNGRALQAFSNWSPRVSATYDLRGDGKTSVHASFSYYFATKITLANSLGGLATATNLTFGSNLSSGACTGRSCWTDANGDGIVQGTELTGTPTASSARFVNGVLLPAGNIVDPDAKIGRTREAIVGVQHELIPNLAVGVDYIYRRYDRGTATYAIGYQPGGPNFPLDAIYTGPQTYTDPTTGKSAPYFVVCDGCSQPQGLGNITVTNLNYQTYNGVTLTVNKRFSSRWQLNGSLTVQDNPNFFPDGSTTFNNPTGREFRDGVSTIARYVFKMNGSYQLPWGLQASANLNWNDGGTRTLTINGPGQVYGGTTGNINYGTLEFQARDAVRFDSTTLLDAGLQKVIAFGGGRYRLKLMADGFNIFNINTIQSYSSGNLSLETSSQVSSIVPPRVFRIGAQISF